MYKQVDVNDKKWERFRKWCVNNDTTIKNEVDKFLDKFEGGNNE